jgi:hypothetical protein
VEDVALAPALEHVLLELGERLSCVHGSEAGHEASILRAPWGSPPGDDIPPVDLIDLRRESPNRPRLVRGRTGDPSSTGRTGPRWRLAGARIFPCASPTANPVGRRKERLACEGSQPCWPWQRDWVSRYPWRLRLRRRRK